MNFNQFILILFQFCELMKEIPSLRRALQQTFRSLFLKSGKIIGSIMDERKLNQIGKQYPKGIIPKKSASGNQTLPRVIFDEKVPFFKI